MPKVLIVEDEIHVLRVLSMWLERHGYVVMEAGNGGEAVDKLRHETVDVIVTDVNMPVMDGVTFVQAVRRDCKLTIPIVMLTARCDQERLARRVAPYDVHLYPKPFVPSRLVADIEKLLGCPTR